MRNKIEHLRLYFLFCAIAGICLLIVRHKYPAHDELLQSASFALLAPSLIGAFLWQILRGRFQADSETLSK
jgi:hypothetical protein